MLSFRPLDFSSPSALPRLRAFSSFIAVPLSPALRPEKNIVRSFGPPCFPVSPHSANHCIPRKNPVKAAAASTVLSLALLLILYRRQSAAPDRSLRPPYRKILRAALPLAVTDDLRSGLSAAENLLVPRRLALYPGTVNALADYGMLCGMVFPVMMFPAAILFSLSELLVPELSRCAARGSRSRVRYLARRSLRVGLLFGLTAAGLLFSGAPALGGLLYGDDAVLWFP